MSFITKYLSHFIFAVAAGYFALLACVAEQDPTLNKMILFIILGLWILWIFAKSFLKILAAVVLVAGMIAAGYYVLNADEIECKRSGREWNKELQVCENKKTLAEKAEGFLRKFFKGSVDFDKELDNAVEKMSAEQ